MAKEGRLKSKDPVPDIIKKIFPAPGKFDEVEFGNIVDTSDRNQIYKTVVDAQTKVSATDKPKLTAVMDDAMKLIDDAIADAAGLKEVFGSKAADAKTIYGKAKKAIAKLKTTMDTSVHTDYNRDDEEVGLGGWAAATDSRRCRRPRRSATPHTSRSCRGASSGPASSPA